MRKLLLVSITAFFLFSFFTTNAQVSNNLETQQMVAKNADSIGLSKDNLNNYIISNSYFNETGGTQMVYLNQSYKGLPVYNQMLVLAFKNGKLISKAGSFLANIESLTGGASATPAVAPADAVRTSISDAKVSMPAIITSLGTIENGKKYNFGKLNIATENITAELMWVPVDDGKNITAVKLAWQVQLYLDKESDYLHVRVDANTNTVVNKNNLTVYENIGQFNAGQNTIKMPAFIKAANAAQQRTFTTVNASSANTGKTSLQPLSPSLVGTANYTVIPYPAESPIHPGGTAAVRTNPWTLAGGNAVTLGWHNDGTSDYTSSRGNNVYAQEDRDNNNNTFGITANSTTTPDPLNFTYAGQPDYTVAPTTALFQQFAITNLFYWNNIIHDITYNYGFTELAGNFQNSNQGRGGAQADYVIADAQDAGGTNNANMSTPADGARPRMQMYLWDPTRGVTTMNVNAPGTIAGPYTAVEGSFSTANLLANVGPVTAQVVYYNDVAAATHEACVTPSNGAALTGKIALINRGNCNFTVKVKNAQDAGAVAVIMVNNAPGGPIVMGGGPDNTIIIPAVMISDVDGATIAAQLANNVNVTLSGTPGGTIQLDGDIDNGIVGHEFFHGVSNRLTGGPAQSGCLGNAEQGGEGWSDYFALMLTTNWSTALITDGVNKPRPMGNYAFGLPVTGAGIRLYPYSTNITVNPLTYASVGVAPVGTEVHNIGEVWCMALWEMTWQLIQTAGINANFFNASQSGGNVVAFKLVMEGMKLQPCSPGFVDARNAILQADVNLYGGAHTCAIWTAFAKRGLGFSALQGSSNSATDQTAAFDLPPTCLITAPTVTINQAAAQPDPTSVSPINFTVVFNEPVTGFTAAGVNLSGTAGATTKVITGSGATYNVAVSGMTTSGTVIATVAANAATGTINATGNAASTSTDNTVTYNFVAGNPTVTINQAAAQPDPTNASPINFTIVFSEAVTGFTAAGVTLSGTAGATTKVVTGSGATYNVAVSGMVTGGTVIATVPANVATGTINVLPNAASTSTDNTVTYNVAVAPSVTINQAATQADPTSVSPINFTVVFSEPVTGFTAAGVTLAGTAGATTKVVTGGPATYNVAVSGMTANGTVIATVPANAATGTVNPIGNTASTSTDNTVTFSLTCVPPTVNTPPNQVVCALANTAPVNFTGTPTAIFNWTNNNTAIGLAASGTGNIPSFVATNTTAAPIVGTITVTPSLPGGGPSGPISFTNPASIALPGTGTSGPGAPYPSNITVSGLATTGVTVKSVTITGLSHTWSDDVDILLQSPTGQNVILMSDIGSAGVFSNNNYTFDDAGPAMTGTAAPASGTYKPTNNVGTIGVEPDNWPAPGPGAVTQPNPALSMFTGNMNGVWKLFTVDDGGGDIGNISGGWSITLLAPAVSTCFGTPVSFTITVNPNPALIIVADPGTTICEGDPTLLTVYNSAGFAPVALTQSSSQTIVAGSVSCNAGGLHTDNSYWRAYNLAPLGLPSALTVNTCTFGVEQATGGAQPVTVRLYTQTTGTFPGGTRTLVGTQAATVPNQALSLFTVTFGTPVVVPNTAVLIVELFTPNGQATGRSFFIGSNAAAQTGPSYISAADCGIATPTDVAAIGFPNMHIILNVAGTTGGVGSIATGTFLWSPAAGLSSTTSNPVAASPMNTTTYTVVRTGAGGCQSTASVTVTVNKRPVVTTQPISRTNCEGNTATFTVGATGTGLTYQWQVNTAGCTGGTWTNLANAAPYSGVNTATLSINPVAVTMSGYGYRCIVSGTCTPFTPPTNVSNCATLTINPNPTVAITPAGPVCGGVAGLFGTLLSTGSSAPPVPGAVTVNSGTINLTVPDGDAVGTSAALTIAGVPANATITNISVKLNLPHTYPHDMIIGLKGPSGQVLSLYKHNTNTTAFPAASIPTAGWFNAVVNKTSSTVFSTVPDPFRYGITAPAGPYKADALNGTTSTGYTIQDQTGFVSNAANFDALYTTPASMNNSWTLALCDGGAGDVGTLTSWSITIDYTTPGTGGGPVLSYVWSPLAGLYTNATATIPYTGTNLPSVYAAPVAQTTYTVRATNVATGCFTDASVLVNYTPPAPTVTPNPVTMCLGDSAVKLKSSSSQAFSSTFTSGAVNIVIPDGPTIPPVPTSYPATTSNITVSGVPAGATVTNLRVKFNITHVYVSDLVIALKAPNGSIINLSALLSGTNGAGANFTNTVISSAGTAAQSSGTAPFTGTFKADLAGATFTALGFTWPGGPTGYVPTSTSWNSLYSTANGVWSVGIYDAGAPDGGVLNNWSLDVDYIVGVPTSAAVWTPAAGLFSNAAATIPYVAGTMVDSVWTRPTPSGVYNYQVTVNNVISTGGPISLPPQATTFSGNVRGYWFTAPSNFTMTSINVPTDASTGNQHIAVVRFTGATPPPAFPGTTNAFTTLFLTQNNTAAGVIPVNIPISAGDVIGILGDRGADVNSYSGLPPNTTVINGTTVNLTRMGMQFPLATTAPRDIWQEPAGAISRVFFSTGITGPGTCTSPARTVVVTVNTPATITTQPVNQTICTDKVATFTVVPAGSGPFTYQWQVSTNSGNNPWTNITNGGVYSGATTATLTITAPPVSYSGNHYRVIVQGAAPCGSVTSLNRILTVNPLPVILISASPTSLYPGLVANFTSTVTPNAAGPNGYVWLRDGAVLSASSIGINSGIGTGSLAVNVDGLGVYQLRVTDVNGCTNVSNQITIKDSVTAKCFIYPNPTSGTFEVRYYSATGNSNLPRYLTVYDAKGDRVYSKLYSIGRPYDRMPVDMRAYGKGLYWVEIGDANGNRLAMCRLVIQ